MRRESFSGNEAGRPGSTDLNAIHRRVASMYLQLSVILQPAELTCSVDEGTTQVSGSFR